MRYVITATRQTDSRSVSVETPSHALDMIDDLAAAGFRLNRVLDQDGNQVDAMAILKQWMDEAQTSETSVA